MKSLATSPWNPDNVTRETSLTMLPDTNFMSPQVLACQCHQKNRPLSIHTSACSPYRRDSWCCKYPYRSIDWLLKTKKKLKKKPSSKIHCLPHVSQQVTHIIHLIGHDFSEAIITLVTPGACSLHLNELWLSVLQSRSEDCPNMPVGLSMPWGSATWTSNMVVKTEAADCALKHYNRHNRFPRPVPTDHCDVGVTTIHHRKTDFHSPGVCEHCQTSLSDCKTRQSPYMWKPTW